MNRILKPTLILLGIALISYAIWFPIANIDSPKSSFENNILSDAHQGDSQLIVCFDGILDQIHAGWTPVLLLGFAIAIAACFIKTDRKSGDHR